MIGVVVVHYDDPAGLDRVLIALEAAGDIAVVVADDGSSTPPTPGPRPYPVEVVTQEDLGFRAAAARNLGARTLLAHHSPDVLLFLDGDTVPGPEYVRRMTDAVRRTADTAPGRRAVVVGRRRYADLTGLSARAVAEFVAAPTPARILPDPAWLDDGYAQTADLTRADDRSYRFVISSVLGMTPEMFTAVGGFDESFVGYGGEDWDLGQRTRLAGADLRHVPDAVAWHDGPDAAGRDAAALTDEAAAAEITARSTAETLRVARVITEPGARDPGLIWEYPDVVVEVDDVGAHPVDVLLTCADLVRGTDARVWLRDGAVLRDGVWPPSDPRVRIGPVPADVLARARYRVTAERPVRLTVPLADLCRRAPVSVGGLVIRHARDVARGVAPPSPTPDPTVRSPRGDHDLEAEWGWRTADTLPTIQELP